MQNNKLASLEKRKIRLIRNIEVCENAKIKLNRFVDKLNAQFARGSVKYEEYESTLKNVLKNRTLEQWNNYYDNCIRVYREHLKICEDKIKQTENNKVLLTALLIFAVFGMLGLSLFYLDSDITGFAVFNVTDGNLSEINETGISATVNITEYYCDYDGTNFTVCETISWSNGSYAKGYISGTKALPQVDQELNSPFTYCQTTDKEGSKALHAYVYDSNDQVIISKIDAKVRCEVTNITNVTTEVDETIVENVTEEVPINLTIINADVETEQTIQYGAVIGQPVKWKKIIKLKEKTTNLEIELPKEVSILSIKKVENNETVDITSDVISSPNPITGFFAFITGFAIFEEPNATSLVVEQEIEEVEIEYETEAPQIFEEETSDGKRIIIYSAMNYENVSTFTNIADAKQSSIKLYWIVNGSRQTHAITEYKDNNNNGLVDEIYWVTPHLSNQTFDIVIEITKASHLDSNYVLISEIYNETKSLDNIWSGPINHSEYVRVTFEQKLNSTNDITVYARNTQGLNTTLEVYYYNSSTKIAEFPIITNTTYYTIYLTNLVGSSDAFDLKIVNKEGLDYAYLEFDHIIDPQAFPDGTTDLGATACSLGSSVANADTFDDACAGTYPGTCGTADRLCDGGSTETTTYNKNVWGNVHMQTGNSSVTDCDSVGDVWLCYDWNVDATDPTQCIVKVDADANASFTNVNTTCFNGGTTSPVLICQNVTNIGETWTCDSFFGSGTKAVARIGVTRTSNGGRDGMVIDALFFNVTYVQAADNTRPSAVNLTMPPNNELNRSTTWSFESNASDSVGVVNATLYHNISGSWTANQTVTVSGTSQVRTIINVSNVIDGRYIWNVQWCDAAGNCNQSNANFTFTVDSARPSDVNLSSPANEVINTSRTWRFESNASDALGLVNATLYHNISGSWTANQTVTVSGTSGVVTTMNVTDIVDGGYTWNVQWCDAAGNCNQSDANFTFTINNPPSGINLTSPPNATSNTSTTWRFDSNASDARGLANATLYHNISGSWVANQTVSVTGTTAVTSINVSNVVAGGYTWNFQWCDGDSNCSFAISNSIFTVTEITNVAPTAHNVSVIAAQSITEASTTAVQFSFLASDSDGVDDLNDSSATAEFQAIGETTRSNTSCLLVGDLNASTANYTCTVDLWYFDAAGNWTVNATIKDLSAETGANTSSNFTLQETAAMVMAPSALTWDALSIGVGNQTSTNDPLTINNTGNKNITIGNLNITAINLQGEIIRSRYLNVSNFTVHTATGGSPPVECGGIQLVNATSVITGADGNLTRGNNSASLGQEEVYFCLVNITAGATPQAYSTGNVGLWTVSIQ
ncbi:MAG: hypothetical protein Q8R00_03930 [Candidatus Nanoarchaeia archaeon]|nr:hypothetical protein [Candidatus Nanoarchaeia archaeon]